VIKFGGAVLSDLNLVNSLAKDIALLYHIGIKIIVVHGGGPQITEIANKLGLSFEFTEKGMRKTDSRMIEVAEMVLQGNINKKLSTVFSSFGIKCVGISGVDNFTLSVKPVFERIGEIKNINIDLIETLLRNNFSPIIAPLGINEDNFLTYNINADYTAGALAGAISAFRLFILTDVDGIYSSLENSKKTLFSSLTIEKLKELIAEGVIKGGMIPKAEAAIWALNSGVEKVHIINGKLPHSLILELFTDKGIGTQITKSSTTEQ
jgi:acetylglutamate kinase